MAEMSFLADPIPDIPTSQGFYEGDVFLDHSLDHHPGLVFLTIKVIDNITLYC